MWSVQSTQHTALVLWVLHNRVTRWLLLLRCILNICLTFYFGSSLETKHTSNWGDMGFELEGIRSELWLTCRVLSANHICLHMVLVGELWVLCSDMLTSFLWKDKVKLWSLKKQNWDKRMHKSFLWKYCPLGQKWANSPKQTWNTLMFRSGNRSCTLICFKQNRPL